MGETEDLIAEQIAYYRARAPWYDDWWNRRGRYSDRRVDEHADELRVLSDDLAEWLQATHPQDVLEIAAGTGELTRRIAPHVARILALDSAPETLEINRGKLGVDAARVEFDVADVFAWHPPRVFDAVVFGFWISHVPRDRWDHFWSTVRAALRPSGHIWFIDNSPPPEAQASRLLHGDGVIDQETDVHVRDLPDGRVFRAVKHFYVPAELERDLEARGFDITVRAIGWDKFIGRGRLRVDGTA
jgi:demethylmenaquinone methyltransferase/2-methoxy-6-polyprenyl-1,4-benzoquinol methylase